MTANGVLQILIYFAVLLLLAKPLGAFMANVYEGRRTFLSPALSWLERLLYRISRVSPDDEMDWRRYAIAMMLFNMAGLFVVYVFQRVQGMLPLNPAKMSAVAPHSALNVAVSFATNTNWQNYGGEATLSYLTQMAALTVQNFLSAASGMAVLVALIRGFIRRETNHIGNFWADMVRGTLYILLPLSLILALLLVSQGVVQTFAPYKEVVTLEGAKQTLALGPAASQIAIKQLGTNGGGFFNVNSAHPFENATPLANLLEMLAILVISGALCYTFGRMIGDTRQGWMLLSVMTVVLVAAIGFCYWSEQRGNPALDKLGVTQRPLTADSANALASTPGGNMEGKEVRIGIANSTIWAAATTAASNGSVNAMHDSFTPLGGLIPLWMIQLGEVIYGGVGSGLYGMIVFVIVAVFVAGLMVGRTPEYLGKKIGPYEMKMASIAILIVPLLILVFTAIAVVLPGALASRANPGAHGLSEILYAFSSMANNNGSAFGGLNCNTPFYNYAGAFAMLAGRYWVKLAVLAIAGSLARKKIVPASSGTLPTHTPLFAGMLLAVVFTVGALTFFPALALGPIVEHLMLFR
jgi:potassium-transporting ATPase potassium-binding subunit